MAQWFTEFQSRHSSTAPISNAEPQYRVSPVGTAGSGRSGYNPTQYREKTFPEAVQVEDFVPENLKEGEHEEGIANVLDAAVRLPTYTGDRPIALAQQATTDIPILSDITNAVTSAIPRVPVVGDAIDTVSSATQNLFDQTFANANLLAAPINAQKSLLWQQVASLRDDETLPMHIEAAFATQFLGAPMPFWLPNLIASPEGQQFLNPFDSITKGEFRENMLEAGYTEAELRALENGEASPIDFALKNSSYNFTPKELMGAMDMINRVVGDPLNLLFVPGAVAGIAGKVGATGLSALSKVETGAKAARGIQRAHKAFFTTPVLARKAQALQLAAGSTDGVGLVGMADRLKKAAMLGGATKRAAKGYGAVAMATTLGQATANLADEVLPGDFDILFGGVFDFAKKMGERKPLSDNDALVFASLLTLPVRSAVGEAWAQTGRKVIRKYHKYAPDTDAARYLYPDTFKNAGPEAARAQAIKAFGSDASWQTWLYQVLRSSFYAKHAVQQTRALPKLFSVRSRVAAEDTARLFNDMLRIGIRDALEGGALGRRDIERGINLFVEQRGGALTKATQGLRQSNFTADEVLKTWQAWEPRQAEMSSLFGPKGGPLGVGLQTDVIVDTELLFIEEVLGMAQRSGKTTYSHVEVNDLLRMSPGIANEGVLAPTFQRAMTTSAANDAYEISTLLKEIKRLRDESPIVVPREEYYRSAEMHERSRELAAIDTMAENSRIAMDGGPVYNVGTGINRATAQFDFAGTRVAHTTMVEGDGTMYSNALRLRGEPDTFLNARAVSQGWEDSGLGLQRSYDAVVLGTEGGAPYAAPAIIGEINSLRPVEDGLTALVTGMEATGATHGRVVVAGDILKQKGLVENATEYVYTVGQRNAEEWDRVLRYLSDYGENVRVIDTGDGVVSIILRDDAKRLQRKLAQTEKRLGKPASERVYVQDVFANRRKSDVANGKYSLKQLSQDIRSTDPRYFDAQRYIDVARGRTRGGAAATRAQREIEAREALADRSAGASGAGRSGTELTRFERQRGTGATGRSEKYALDTARPRDARITQRPRDKRHWEEVLNDKAGLTDSSGGRFSFRPGDLFWRTNNSRAGAIVRDNGELILWDTNPGAAKKPADFDQIVSEAAEFATWVRGPEPVVNIGESTVGGIKRFTDVTARAASGQHNGLTWVDSFAEHGFWPAYRGKAAEGGQDILYLVRDVDGEVLGVTQFQRGRYLQDMQDSRHIIEVRPEQARTSAEALGTRMWPQQAARARQALRDKAIMEGVAPRSAWSEQRRSKIINETLNKGRVRHVARAERDIHKVIPNFEEGVLEYLRTQQVPDDVVAGVIALEDKLRRAGAYVNAEGKLINSSNYVAKVLPGGVAPYYRGQNEAYEWVMRGKQAADTGVRQALSKMDQMLDNVIGARYAVELGKEQRQAMLDAFVQAGAPVGQVNRFISVLGAVLETSPGWGGAKWYRSIEKLPPGTIRDIATGKYPLGNFKGFDKEVLDKLGDPAALMQRSGSRIYRQLEKRFPAEPGKRNLGNLIERTYGKQHMGGMADIGLAGARKGAWAAGVAYNVWRFLLDPRWWAMNLMEGDILGVARWGEKVRGVAGGKARPGGLRGLIDTSKGRGTYPPNQTVETLAGRRADSTMLSIEEVLKADRAASGWMDPRAMYGYVSEAVNVTKDGVTAKLLSKMVDEGSPVTDDLKRLWGDDPDAWVREIDDMLFGFDTDGIANTIARDETARLMAESGDPVYAEFLMRFHDAHVKNYKDIVHTFHGNVNRSNLERLLNSPFLWWPLSYQLKTGKWLLDMMTKSFLGRGGELAGSGMLAKLLANHTWSMENNDEYRSMMEDHPAAFQALAMFLPITPFDLGVYMGRWTRYSGSWLGAQLGLNDPDPSYPQDPVNFIIRSLSLGPVYSKQVFDRIWREFEE